MKNAKTEQCKRAIVIPLENFRDLVYELCRDNVDVTYDGCRLLVSDACGNSGPVYNKLGKHFDVKIESLHVDPDSDNLDVWISYQNIFRTSK